MSPKKMHLNTCPKFISFNLKTLSAAVVSAMLFSNANAAGLGKLTVLSSLGQPLHAEIELTAVSKDDIGTLVPKLASPEAFRQANIEFNPTLFSLRFAVEQRAGRQFIRITSSQPINEPFVDMLLELGGAGNRLVREYTFLLDPADLRSSQSPQVAAPIILPPAPLARRLPEAAPSSESAPRAQEEKPISIDKIPRKPVDKPAKPAPAASQPSTPAVNAPSSEYRVKPGDSLSKIAAQVKPEGVSLDQMLVSLYRANPDAFLGNNMNRLRAGQILAVPDSSTASSVSATEAHGIVLAQSADFNGYRNKLADQVATAAPKKTTESKQSATGKITAKVEEPTTPASEAKDKLKLSKSGTQAAKDKSSTIAPGTEEKIAKDKALAEANSRVKELEKNLSDLNKLLEIKSKNLEEQQKLADAAKAAGKQPVPPVAAASVPPVSAKPPEVKPAEVKPAEAKPAEVKPAEVKPDEVKPAEVKPAESKAPEPQPVEPPKPAATEAASASVPPVAAVPKPKPVPAPRPEPSFFDDMAENPLFLGLGALLAGVGLFGLYRFWSSRKQQKKNFEDSIITDSSLKANSLFGSTGGQSVDTNNSVFNSNFTPSSSNLDTNEVDPVAEADVYIAYGRDAQAEEILKEALRTQPGRNAVRVKLLEIYSNRKDLRAFEVLASELYGLTKGEGEDWVQAASLGLALDPNNPLYAAGKRAEAPAAKPSLVMPTQPLDEPDLDALLAVTQSDKSLEAADTVENSAYFTNTSDNTAAVAKEPAIAAPEPVAHQAPAPAPKPTVNELDFDLEGMNGGLSVPNTVTRTPVPEPKADFAEINFDFLNETPAQSQAESIDVVAPPIVMPEVKAPVEQEILVEDFALPKADFSSPLEMPVAPAPSSPVVPAAAPAALEFDLSDIALTLEPGDEKLKPAQESHDVMIEEAPEYSNSAEMATKLDLAVAYQEIGDKEGARELLDEVVRGGTPEQSEKAKSILQKLG